jgi:hypothetical protein
MNLRGRHEVYKSDHLEAVYLHQAGRLVCVRADVRFGFDSAVSVTGHKFLKYTFSVDSVARCYKLGMLGV